MNVADLPPFDAAFGRQVSRLRGIASWEQVSGLGRANVERLVQLAQERVYLLLAEGSSRDELRAVRGCIDYLNACITGELPVKPLLPRLRAENFRQGDQILLYIADSPGNIAPRPWVPATITDVAKSYRAEWADGTASSGYYWRLTATATCPLFPEQHSVAFSTSEPRAVPVGEFECLTGALHDDAVFVDIYSANAWRTWDPLWCLERGISSAGAAMDMKAWLYQFDQAAQTNVSGAGGQNTGTNEPM